MIFNQSSLNSVIYQQTLNNEALGKIESIKSELAKLKDFDKELLENLKEWVDEVETKVKSYKTVPKTIWQDLLADSANVASISSLVLELGKALSLDSQS